ncbi:hypothetical protein RO3G_07022 [Rhizopus delemar RA 99-880]|uniref:Uncharacterized protein n=1 Tax=Rhizopus delemar (strain RA 99-880 / ATCC MYA-4621 / FGSC 9543 / NRRL 43880) TaxID=246409 RepID=I1C1I7_RHIO9|nr:hypothetical protein RO3G_07022 [Rhizopus delemar RA 99-880]|eukprot:EIE82317.1 hypothetical protein RO3G_07022 [Rhizopus delemar RA 99-880]
MSLTSLRPEPDLERKGKLKALMGAMIVGLRRSQEEMTRYRRVVQFGSSKGKTMDQIQFKTSADDDAC